MERQSVLLVDDEVSFRDRLGRALTDRGYEVTTAGTVREALAMAEQDSPEFALVDLRLPDGSGLDAVRALLGIDAHTHVVVLTGYGSIATALEAVRLGARDYLTKPVDADQVMAAFQKTGPSVEGAPEVTTPSLARVEWEHIQRVLADCGGNVSQAARVLGIHRRSLQRKLGKYPVRR